MKGNRRREERADRKEWEGRRRLQGRGKRREGEK